MFQRVGKRASISQKHASLKSHSLLSCYNLFCLFTSSVWKEGFNLAKTCVFEISLTSFMLQPFFAFAFYMGQIKFQVSSTLLQLGQAPTVIPVFEDLLLLLPLSNSTFSWRLDCTYTKIELETGEALKMSFFPKKSASEFQGFLFFSRVCTFITLRGKPKRHMCKYWSYVTSVWRKILLCQVEVSKFPLPKKYFSRFSRTLLWDGNLCPKVPFTWLAT